MPSSTVPRGTGNQLVDAFPSAIRGQFRAMARQVDLPAFEEVITQGARVRQLYFPCSAVISLMIGLASGQRAEFGTVGREGVAGLSRLLGVPKSPEYGVVQMPGDAWAMDAARFEALRDAHPSVGSALRSYAGYAYRLAAQSTVCVAYHSIEERLARWLLTTHDRARSDQMPITQEQLAHWVGATRPRVSEAAGRLRAAGAIDYRAGRLRVAQRDVLEAFACECYGATRLPPYL